MKILALVFFLWVSFLAICQQAQEVTNPEQVVNKNPTPHPQAGLQRPPKRFPKPPPPEPEQKQPLKMDYNTLKIFKHEVFFISAALLYLVIYLRGKRTNVKLMEKFYRRVESYLETNFAHIGFTTVSGQAPFNSQSPNESIFYASGRDNVQGIEIKFQTKKRQDLLYLLLDLLIPDRDTVTIDIPMSTDIPLVLAIAEKKRVKDLSDKNIDIRKLTKPFFVNGFPQNYQILGEAVDTVDSIIDNHVTKKLNLINGLILSIHYTDLKMYSQNTGHLRLVLNLAHKKDEHFLPGLELALYLADKIANYKISATSKAKALKSREIYNQSKEKQDLERYNEERRKKKEQKLRKQEEWLRSLPPEKQKKEEQKRRKNQFSRLVKGKTMKA